MSLLHDLRRKGHEARLDGQRVVVRLRSGADVTVATRWAVAHEQQLRRELVTELQALAGVRGVFPDARVRKVLDENGDEIVGQVVVVSEAERRRGSHEFG